MRGKIREEKASPSVAWGDTGRFPLGIERIAGGKSSLFTGSKFFVLTGKYLNSGLFYRIEHYNEESSASKGWKRRIMP